MFGSGDITLEIGSNLYRLIDLYGKTLFSTKKLPVFYNFRTVGKNTLYSTRYVSPSNVVGIVRGYKTIKSGPLKGDYLLVGTNSKALEFVPYDKTNFSESYIKQQGIKTAEEVAKDAEKTPDAWYVSITKQVMPWLVFGGVGYFLIKGAKNGK